MPALQFSGEMMARLRQFRGGDEFEDDICFACIDII
jgi:serine phosphatase RsbU (regulator of sigma subunit)